MSRVAKSLEDLINEEVEVRLTVAIREIIRVICRNMSDTYDPFTEQSMYDKMWEAVGTVHSHCKSMDAPLCPKLDEIRCRGKTNKGKRCNFKANTKFGYCTTHQNQEEKERVEVPVMTVIEHNHDIFRQRYSESCPACMAKTTN